MDKDLEKETKTPRIVNFRDIDRAGMEPKDKLNPLWFYHFFAQENWFTSQRVKEVKEESMSDKKSSDLNFKYEVLEKLNNIETLLERIVKSNDKNIEIQEIQDLSEETIERIILDYLKRNKDKEIYPSDIAFAFNLEAKKVFEISQRLKKEGKLV
ncbi:MAG: hypothetical protein BAJALOKI1v1_1100017 [Promethearchaeota archaeon]|nr:MAG: hypothetical protein BAJALOKI1v1_1100017 [Candidatus Lokiarchaeota archaeon]